MKISTMLRVSLMLFLAFSLASTGMVFLQLEGMTQDSAVINYAGVVRGGTQRLVKMELSNQPADELIAKMDGLIDSKM